MLIVVQLHDLCGDVGFERRVVVGELGEECTFQPWCMPFHSEDGVVTRVPAFACEFSGVLGIVRGMLCIGWRKFSTGVDKPVDFISNSHDFGVFAGFLRGSDPQITGM